MLSCQQSNLWVSKLNILTRTVGLLDRLQCSAMLRTLFSRMFTIHTIQGKTAGSMVWRKLKMLRHLGVHVNWWFELWFASENGGESSTFLCVAECTGRFSRCFAFTQHGLSSTSAAPEYWRGVGSSLMHQIYLQEYQTAWRIENCLNHMACPKEKQSSPLRITPALFGQIGPSAATWKSQLTSLVV